MTLSESLESSAHLDTPEAGTRAIPSVIADVASNTSTQAEVLLLSAACPPDITSEQAESFKKLGLTYELSPEGHYICVYEDPETREISRFVYGSQAWIDVHRPGGADKWKDIDVRHPWNLAWDKEGIVKHTTEGGSPIWHFNKSQGGLEAYIKETLAPNNLALAERSLTEKLACIFQGNMHTAFGIDLTSWSTPDGHLNTHDIDHSAASWLKKGNLDVHVSKAGCHNGRTSVNDIRDAFGLGLFLQYTTSDVS